MARTHLLSADAFLPARRSLRSLRDAAAGCRGCELYAHATQTVFGEGARAAELVLVGEQPGDREDLEGRPFVGPAGRLLDALLEEAGIDRELAYVTNAVKHFKWRPRGKRRIHQKPSWSEFAACRPWLDAELALLEPTAIVCLGATAAQALLGPQFRVTRERGVFVESPLAKHLLATFHPSSVLRAPDDQRRHELRSLIVEDLRKVAAVLPGVGV
jgi:uracil-DNA glycosylase